MEQFVESLFYLNPLWVYIAAASIAYIENIFPPFPSDIVLVAAGYLCAVGRVDFYVVLLVSTVGSTAGFMTMYKIGFWFGLRVIETGKLKFLQLDKIHKVEAWFKKYGYSIVIINRFLAGTRAIVSLFTGISNLSFWKTTFLAAFSSLVWNTILLLAGKALGSKWRAISYYLDTYWIIVTIVTIVVIILVIIHGYFLRSKNKNTSNNYSESNTPNK